MFLQNLWAQLRLKCLPSPKYIRQKKSLVLNSHCHVQPRGSPLQHSGKKLDIVLTHCMRYCSTTALMWSLDIYSDFDIFYFPASVGVMLKCNVCLLISLKLTTLLTSASSTCGT